MSFENLPGIFPKKQDGFLQIVESNSNPIVVVLGTSPSGDSETLYTVTNPSTDAKVFGKSDGTLVRGMYEAMDGGANNLKLWRLGAKPAILADIGNGTNDAGAGIIIETIAKDASAGTDYKLFWDDTAERLRIWRVSDDMLVYDNNPAYPSGAVDEQELSVTGTPTGTAGVTRADLGTLLAPITLQAAGAVTAAGATYTAGSDGITLSRMELFENLYNAYQLLENEDFDFVIPMNTYIDDDNTSDMSTTEVEAVNINAPWASSSTYPTAGTFYDVLGKVFIQEYQGKNYFWWDLNRDGKAEIWPTIAGNLNPDLDTDAFGEPLTIDNYEEANFAYQLADFCYRKSENHNEILGVIGTRPPLSWSLKDVANWIGKEPVTSTDTTTGLVTITANGTGLFGVKWLTGRKAGTITTVGLPGHAINGTDGLYYGGFVATDTGWPGGTQQLDDNDHIIDLGKYISVVSAQAIFNNPTSTSSYVASGAARYMGFVSSLPAQSAPTNKVVSGIRLPFNISVSKLDTLAGYGYINFQKKPKGIVVADAPTASRPDSDYRRLTTIRIVKDAIDAIRAAGEPFLGEGTGGAEIAALDTAIRKALNAETKARKLQRYEFTIISTPLMAVQGKADVVLKLVPVFELRMITVSVSLAAQ